MEKEIREYYKVKGWDIEEVEEMGRKGIERGENSKKGEEEAGERKMGENRGIEI